MATQRVAVAVATATLGFLACAQAASADGWAITPIPAPTVSGGQLSGVSCASSQTCVAVGSYYGSSGYEQTLAEVRTNSGWSVETTPGGGEDDGLASVSCPTTKDCIAVGTASNYQASNGWPLSEQWDGSGWSSLSTPDPDPRPIYGSGLDAVSCSSTTACMAVGSYSGQPYAEFWDGHAWSTQLIADPSGAAIGLDGISCTSSTACSAVGAEDGTGGFRQPVVESWDGSDWLMQTAADPAGASSATLSAISCTDSTSCTAVGFYNDSSGTEYPLAERWDGQSWSIQTNP